MTSNNLTDRHLEGPTSMILVKRTAVFHSLPSNDVGWVGHCLAEA